jgi:hypothetical protein
MSLRYRVRCGDCDTVLAVRVMRLGRIVRLMACHRLKAGCAASGFIVRPVGKVMA